MTFISDLIKTYDGLPPREAIAKRYEDKLREKIINLPKEEADKLIKDTDLDCAFGAIVDYLEDQHSKKHWWEFWK